MADLLIDPGVGDPAAIRRLAADRDDDVDDLDLVLLRGGGALAEAGPPVWEGASCDAFRAGLEEALRDVRTLRTGLDEHAEALRAYARAVEQIQERQRDLERRRRDLDREREAALHEEGLLLTGRPTEALPFGQLLPAAADRLTAADAAGRRLDLDWDDLVADRRRADATCIAALGSTAALGKLALVLGSSSAGCPTPQQLLRYLSDLSATDLALLAERHPELLAQLTDLDPQAVHDWWASMDGADPWSLSPQQALLVAALPALLGSLDGLPPHARVAANAVNAARRIELLERQLRRPGADVTALERELAYLLKTQGPEPEVQLYLYEPEAHRIIEMFGAMAAQTEEVLTFVPGTFGSVESFFGPGGPQELPRWLQEQGQPDATVAFAFKDGRFPGEFASTSLDHGLAFIEANSESFARESSRSLQRFQRSLTIGTAAMPNRVTTTAIGHSWGLADITASEIWGARYDRVVSLSGAGMPSAWRASPGTRYFDLSYYDELQNFQHLGLVWNGKNPRVDPSFSSHEYFSVPGDVGLIARPQHVLENHGHLVDNHNLPLSTTDPSNKVLREELRQLVRHE